MGKLASLTASAMLASAFVFASLASAGNIPIVNIPIVNPSFEADDLANGGFISGSFASGWTVSGGNAGPFDPTPSNVNEVPDGENVAFSTGGTICQTLSDTIEANNRYTLSLEIGRRMGCCSFPGYTVQLKADSVVLVQDVTGVTPAKGDFEPLVLTYDSPDS